MPRHSLLIAASLLAPALSAQPAPITRLAELEINPAHLDAYTHALCEEIETSIRLEPGVLTLYAVALKDHPASIRLFETYATPRRSLTTPSPQAWHLPYPAPASILSGGCPPSTLDEGHPPPPK